MTTTILNKEWTLTDLQLSASTKEVKELLSEYRKDPNCRPYDFVACENIPELQKASFIYSAIKL